MTQIQNPKLKIIFLASLFLFALSSHRALADITTDCSNLAGLYNFNGNAQDSTGKNNPGTMHNGADCNFQGKFGSACKFDGIDDYLNLGRGASLNNLDKFTLSLWVRKLGGESYKVLVSKSSSSRWRWSIYSTGSQFSSYLSHSGAAAKSDSSIDKFNYYDWVHLAATYDITGDRTIHLYVNGAETNYYTKKTSAGSLLANADQDLLVGGILGGDSFEGVIDDLAVYNRALSPAEIKEIYNSNSQLNCGACISQCNGKVCGEDGCGGSCGSCSGGNVCNPGGTACVAKTECTDGIDNDGDGKIDYDDVGCFDSGGSKELMPGELVVKNIQRITPKEYSAGNIFVSYRPVFNLDDSKLLVYENSNSGSKHPLYGKLGRNLTWCKVEDLKNWKTLAEYEQACHPFPNNNVFSQWSRAALWSIFPGEKDIVYASFKDGWLKKFDTSKTGAVWENYINLVPVGATPEQLSIKCFGWDNQKHMICNLNNEVWNTKFGTGGVVGWDIDIPNKVANPVTDWFSGAGSLIDCRPQGASYILHQYHGFNIFSHGHGDERGNYSVAVGGYRLFRLSDCKMTEDPNRRGPYTSHLDWDVSPDWFLADGYPSYNGTEPAIRTSAAVQIFIDTQAEKFGRRLDLHFQDTAQPWVKTLKDAAGNTIACADRTTCPDASWNSNVKCEAGICKKDILNYDGNLLPKLNNSGTAAVFTATEGKYSVTDWFEYGKDRGWTGEEVGTTGLYLMEFGSSNGPPPDTTPPASPTGLTVL